MKQKMHIRASFFICMGALYVWVLYMFKSANGSACFTVPENTEYLWLVVSGAPTEHWPVVFNWGASDDDSKEEQWPYQIKLSGTAPDSSEIS
ncbi:MAG: hypothetical protein JXR82_15710 [Marinifilaceae bacterium]|nr:hypothetical protein [Marinifilaceae bacterium]